MNSIVKFFILYHTRTKRINFLGFDKDKIYQHLGYDFENNRRGYFKKIPLGYKLVSLAYQRT